MEKFKKLIDISRAEWVTWRWVEAPQHGDEDTICVRSYMRTPDECIQAGKDWDEFNKNYLRICRKDNQMTREEILAMPAGRELDALVAEKVMEIPAIKLEDCPCPYCKETMRFCGARSWCSRCHEWRYSPYKEYSEDIAAAFEVVEKLGEVMIRKQLEVPDDDRYWVCFGEEDKDDWTSEATAPTAPLAISRAALIAVMEGKDE